METQNVGMQNIVVGGFSQGCNMALASFLHYPEALGGCVGLCGALCTDMDFDAIPSLNEKQKRTILLYHGSADEHLPHDLALITYRELERCGFALDITVEEGLRHSVSHKMLIALKLYLQKALNSA